jgi:hypothetical protein
MASILDSYILSMGPISRPKFSIISSKLTLKPYRNITPWDVGGTLMMELLKGEMYLEIKIEINDIGERLS